MSLEDSIRKYLDGTNGSDGRKPDARYTSFDYCFNYFQSFHEAGNVEAVAHPDNLQVSCLHLAFYLASWGMLRPSTNLLQKSARHLVPAIRLIADADSELWEIDAHCYTERNIQQLLETRDILCRAYPTMTDTLATKIMLGVFGNVPAFDKYFIKGFKGSFGLKALRRIATFYGANSSVIDDFQVPTLDFATGEPTSRKYTRAKVIDMAFFIEGMS